MSKHEFKGYWECDCGCDTMVVGHQEYTGKTWVTLQQMEDDPGLRDEVNNHTVCPALWVTDFTNIKCDGCGRRISGEEWEKVLGSIPKTPISEWTCREEIGIGFGNIGAIGKLYLKGIN